MGMFDTMNQAKSPAMGSPIGGTPNAMGQGFAQQKSPSAYGQQKPVGNMQRPNNNIMGMKPRPNPTTGQIPGQMGSRSQIMEKQKAMQAQQAQAGTISGSYGELASKYPNLVANRQTGMNVGQDMSWMDKPGALQMASDPAAYNRPAVMSRQPQGGLAALQTPYDMQQQAAANPIQSAQEQMRGYDGPDLGSQDPREVARMGQSLPGVTSLQNAPYGGEMPGNNSFQSMMEQMGGQRPDVMSRGLGPSYGEMMDENGLEPRRGAR